MTKVLRVLVVFLMVASPAMAVTIKGVGAGSCSDWTDKRGQTDPTMKFGVESWVLGYMSAIAEDKKRDILNGTDAEAIFKEVDILCALKPGQLTADAARRLVDYLSK